MNRQDDLQVIADFYGLDSQRNILIEEMAELTQALIKTTRIGEFAIDDVKEEMADVEIMLYQIKYLLGINTDIVIDYKVNRQMSRIDSDKVKYQE